jgi:anti-anti-sigma factor
MEAAAGAAVERIAKFRAKSYRICDMPIEKWSDKVNVLHLADDPQFSEDLAALEAQVGSKPVNAVLDFSAVHFINSSNIARLLKFRKHMINSSRRLVLCGVATQVWGTFMVTGLDKVFEFSDSVPAALDVLKAN